MKKLIFLDINGVIVNKNKEFQEESCTNIKKLIDETGAKVVITSSMRKYVTNQEIRLSLPKYIAAAVIGYTPVGNFTASSSIDFNVPKGIEVKQWLLTNKGILGCKFSKYRSYVIIDDNSDFLYDQTDNLILCESGIGLSHHKFVRAKEILSQ